MSNRTCFKCGGSVIREPGIDDEDSFEKCIACGRFQPLEEAKATSAPVDWRAAAFLRALGPDFPAPLHLTHHWDVDGEISLHWVDTRSPVRETVVWVWPDKDTPLETSYRVNGVTEIESEQCGWNPGETVPPEIVAAIRRVTE